MSTAARSYPRRLPDIAGIVPGLLLGLGLCVAWYWVVRKENLSPPPRASLREILHAIIDGFWALMLPGIIIVGLRFGIFTPTEAGQLLLPSGALFVASLLLVAFLMQARGMAPIATKMR